MNVLFVFESGLDHISLSILLELNNTITHEEALCITSAVLHTMRFPTGLTLPSPNNPAHPPYMICSFQIWLIACLLRLSLMPQISRHTRQFPYLARAARPQEQMNEERAVMWGSFVFFFFAMASHSKSGEKRNTALPPHKEEHLRTNGQQAYTSSKITAAG